MTSLSHWPIAVARTVGADALLLRSAVFCVRLIRNRLQVSRCATSMGSHHLLGWTAACATPNWHAQPFQSGPAGGCKDLASLQPSLRHRIKLSIFMNFLDNFTFLGVVRDENRFAVHHVEIKEITILLFLLLNKH